MAPGQKGKYKPRVKKAPPIGAAADQLATATIVTESKRELRIKEEQERRRTMRGQNGGWLKVGGWGDGKGTRTPSMLREKAREVLAELGYPELANIILDPDAKDADKLRAVDILAKMAVGYMTPELAAGEDAPDLPPPIIQTTTGALPGEEHPELLPDDADNVLAGESRGEPPLGVLSLHTSEVEPLVDTSGPMPHMSVR